MNDRAEGVKNVIAGVSSTISKLRSTLVSVVRASTEGADRRSEERLQLERSVEVSDPAGRTLAAMLLDISDRGARITCTPEVSIGGAGTLQLPGLTQRLNFVFRSREAETLHVEFAFDGNFKAPRLAWLHSRVSNKAAD